MAKPSKKKTEATRGLNDKGTLESGLNRTGHEQIRILFVASCLLETNDPGDRVFDDKCRGWNGSIGAGCEAVLAR